MANSPPTTIPALLEASIARASAQLAIATVEDGEPQWKTWAELGDDVHRLAAALHQRGISQGDRVAQWAPNSYDWILVDLALLTLGAVHVPLHTSLGKQQVAELLQLADPKLLIVANGSTLPSEINVPQVQHIELCDHNSTRQAEPIAIPTVELSADQLATLLFTSGTTGQPNGVMLSHENLTCNAIATTDAVGSTADETRLCFLPLSHIYARTCDLYSWLYRGSRLVLAENRETIVRDCQLAKPTVINGVPYFYQKISQQLQLAEPGTLAKLFGGELKRCFCGGAAVSPEVAALFERQGLPLLSGYGLTEASPVISATAHDDYRRGTVGKPLPGVETKLSPDGEIQVRGPSVMLGYWNDKDKTDQTIVEGWLHTGDLGEFDEAGHLRIIGRQKELIVLSTGKNVSPQRVEQLLSGSRLVEHVCVVGEGQKYLGALIVPNPEALRAEIRQRRLWVWSRRRAVTHPQIRQLFRQEIDRLLADASAEEQVGCLTILDRNFSIEQGELTAKLSLRRDTIASHFASEIAAMYASPSA